MRIVIVDYENHDIKKLKEALTLALGKNSNEIEFASFGSNINDRPYMFAEIKKFEPDILFTYNLAGFELCTMTDAVCFNLLDCKQLHWIEKKGCINEIYLKKVLSIAMFFATEDKELHKYLEENYEMLPRLYLSEGDNTETNSAKAAVRMAEESGIL